MGKPQVWITGSTLQILVAALSFSLIFSIESGRAMKKSRLGSSNAVQRLPKLIAFDLDGTIWTPDLYRLWGGGAPFVADGDGSERLFDKTGAPLSLLGISSCVLQELKTEDRWSDTKVAWVSCTDEPEWAAECLNLFKVRSQVYAFSHVV